jgi:hypothetical protein
MKLQLRIPFDHSIKDVLECIASTLEFGRYSYIPYWFEKKDDAFYLHHLDNLPGDIKSEIQKQREVHAITSVPLPEAEKPKLITEQFLISKGWKKIGAMINGYDLPGKSIECEFYDGEICIYNEYGPLEGKMYNGPIPTESQYEVLNQLLKLHD